MKKLYTLALAAICTIGASAGNDFSVKQFSNTKNSHMVKTAVKMERIHTASEATHTMADDEVFTVEGDYEITIGDYYFQTSVGEYTAVASIERDGENLVIDCDEFYKPVKATYDETTGVITFTKEKLGAATIGGTTYYIQFEPFVFEVVDEKGSINVDNDITAQFDSETGDIIFEANQGFGWDAYSNALYKGSAGWVGLFDVLGMTPYEVTPIDEVQEGLWKTVGTATLLDAWITPAYKFEDNTQVTPEDAPITAELQQDVTNENRYRLWRPYHDEDWLLVDANQSAYEGQIVFDVTDPEHVVVEAGMPAGFKNSNGNFYVFGLYGWQLAHYEEVTEETKAAIIAFMIEKDQPFDTYDAETKTVKVNRSVFDVDPACSKAYTWQNNEYIVSTISMKLDDSAIEGVAVDNENAPVEYFNLQGVKISNPEAGQIVIRRQGSQVSKQFVK